MNILRRISKNRLNRKHNTGSMIRTMMRKTIPGLPVVKRIEVLIAKAAKLRLRMKLRKKTVMIAAVQGKNP